MPEISLKPLYVAKSFSELNEIVDRFKPDFSTKVLSKHANLAFNKAEVERLQGDEEASYVLYMRFCSIVQNILKRPDYKKNKAFYDIIMGSKRLNDALTCAEQLSKSLTERYELMKAEEMVCTVIKMKDAESHIRMTENKDEEDHKVLANAIDIKKTPPEGIITSRHLYELLQEKDPNIIIFDTRTRKDYQDSHIKHPVCVSFPQEIIQPGVSAKKFEDKLPTESRVLWKKRASVDYIVLLDWDYNELTSSYEMPIVILKKALFMWDVTVRLKREPVFLEGGYKDWLLRYPVITTNSHVSVPVDVPSPTFDEISIYNKSCEYPIDDLEEKIDDVPLDKSTSSASPPLAEGYGTPKSNGTDSPYFGSGNLGRTKVISVDRSTKPKVVASPSKVANGTEYGWLMKEFINSIPIDGLPKVDVPAPSKPQFNRQLKPQLDAHEQQIVSGLVKENNLADLDVQLQKELLDQEKLFQVLRLRKEKEAEEGMRIELQLREENLMEDIQKLEISIVENEKDKAALKKENERLNAELNDIDREAYKKWQDKMEQLRQKENEKKTLYDQVEILRRERKEKEKFEEIKKVDIPKEISTDAAAASFTMGETNATTFEKLKDDVSSPSVDAAAKKGLSRSHSSPNIAQLVQESSFSKFRQVEHMPSFSRQNKPPLMSALHGLDWGSCQPRSKIGLRNLGNTCYMNATLQCLASTTPLAQYLLNGSHLGQIRHVGAKRTGEIGESFVNVIKQLWLGNAKYYTPKEFRNTVGRCHVPFAGSIQQDSHEFLILLLTSLADYLNKSSSYRELKPLGSDDSDNLSDHEAAERVWNVQKKMEDSIILDLFYGQSRSTLKCMHCGKVSTTFDNFNCLSLPIPSKITRCTLTDCLRVYLKEERLTGTSMWHCPRCNELRDAVKKLDIWKLPPILVVHLKRFIYDDIWRDKIQTNVDFAISDLEMKNYVVGPQGNSNYNLYAVSNHYGTLEGGHYVALCKIVNQWIKFDDQDVYEMTLSDVKSSAGYLLFYSSQKPSKDRY